MATAGTEREASLNADYFRSVIQEIVDRAAERGIVAG